MLIARLIADTHGLATRLEAVRTALRSAETSHLGEGVVELVSESAQSDEVRELVAKHFEPSDGLIAQSPIMVPRVFVSDMDSTMIGQECIDELADYAGLKDKIAAITERAMQGELDFEDALKERVSLLKGLREDAITQCLKERIRPNPGARTLVQTLRSKGCTTVLVTGGFHHFADVVGDQIGFETVIGNRLGVSNGALTGELKGEVVGSIAKYHALMAEIPKSDGPIASCSIGDGANDIPMIEAATYGFAYHAKPKARAAANAWIDRGDLTSVLRLIGIPQSEWVTD